MGVCGCGGEYVRRDGAGVCASEGEELVGVWVGYGVVVSPSYTSSILCCWGWVGWVFILVSAWTLRKHFCNGHCGVYASYLG